MNSYSLFIEQKINNKFWSVWFWRPILELLINQAINGRSDTQEAQKTKIAQTPQTTQTEGGLPVLDREKN